MINRLYIENASMIKFNRIFRDLSFLLICTILIPVFSGCSIVGLTIGATADSDHPDRVNRPVIDLDQIKPGKTIELILFSNETLEGKYKGTGMLPRQEYDSLFHEYLNNSNELSAFPAPGDTITVFDLSGNQLEFVLIGYGIGYLSVHRTGEEKTIAILTRQISSMLLRNGETISGTNLEKTISDRKLPLIQTLILDSGGNTREVPADSIVQITEIDKNYRIWVGLAVGFAIDYLVATLYISGLKQAFSE